MKLKTIVVFAYVVPLLVAVGNANARPANQDRNTHRKQPNVLFIAVDDLKPVLGCYGNELAITPSLDRLAAQSTLFLNAYCQFPVCGGSRASLMTGLRPESTGVMDLKTNMRAKNPDVVTIPQYFRQNGYATTGVGKIYDPRCVDNRTTNDKPSWSIPFSGVQNSKIKFGKMKPVVLAPDVDDTDLTDGSIARKGLELLRDLSQNPEKPFFLAVGFKKPHLPFVAPKKYWDLYDPDTIKLAEHRGGIKNASGYSIHDSNEFRGYEGVPENGPISEELQRKSIHGYLACVSFVDAQVGLLMQELKKLGIDDNTIVIVWSDHGFHLGDHCMWGKHSTLENAARVPLMIRTIGDNFVAEIHSPVELVDIYPTLAESCGLPGPTAINGRSLVPLITAKTKHVRDGALTIFKKRGSLGYSFRTQRFRYTQWVNKDSEIVAKELYDYEVDPNETINVANLPSYLEIQSTLAHQLRSHAQGCERFRSIRN